MRVLIKGAGDLASGIAHRLHKCGMQVMLTELPVPVTVRRKAAFSRAVYERQVSVEDVTGQLVRNAKELETVLDQQKVAVIIDPSVTHMDWYRPDVLVDAILAKRNTGTSIRDAALVIGVGPGFCAGQDCHYVIETKRGHYLGKVLTVGTAIPNTGIPGDIGGFTEQRLIKAEAPGIFIPLAEIGETVHQGQVVAYTGEVQIQAKMSGMVRGMLQSGLYVEKGMKCGDIDARCEQDHCFTISDKSRAVAGGVLEAIYRKR